MRTQSPSTYQLSSVSTIDVLLKILLPALFARPTLAEFHSFFQPRASGLADCPLRQFKCNNGRCVQLAWMCDKEDDCGDNSDETAPICIHPRKCNDNEYTCKNGICIPLHWHCDQERDCPDGSDEGKEICGIGKCDKNQFECRPGECIPKTWVCDGKLDCHGDGLDEKHCNKTCEINEFTCANGRCINLAYKCDMDNDCGDMSDEKNCALRTCANNDYQCGDKSCIPQRWKCDGDYDCPDKSDEENCMASKCSENDYQCPDQSGCIHASMLCDGEDDCLDGSDERPELCRNVTCGLSQFQCANKQCIDKSLECNGHRDCSDNSDEENCSTCKDDEFDCGENECIPLVHVCNKKVDCSNGADEPRGKCGVNECRFKNGGCSDMCIDTPTGHRCECLPGYVLTNSTTCVDVNECDHPGSCSQICNNQKGSFECRCEEGYDVDETNHNRCVPSIGQATLLFNRKDGINNITMDGKTETSIYKGSNSARALDFMYSSETIFWSDSEDKKIYKSHMNTGNNRFVVIDSVEICDGLAVDWIYGHIYWTDTGKNTIEMSDIGGKMRKTLISEDLDEPRPIAVNPLDGWMYWSDWGNEGCIERAGLDGNNRQIIASYDVKWPNGLTIDLVGRRLYWIDARLKTISSVNYDGTGRFTVLNSDEVLHHPFSISVFGDSVYWTDWDKQTIFSANKFNGSNVNAITDSRMFQDPLVVHVYHPYRQPNGTNLCAKVFCSHFCLPVPQLGSSVPKTACACPDGLTLLKDGKTCMKGAIPNTPSVTNIDLSDNDIPVMINREDNDIVAEQVGQGTLLYSIIGVLTVLIAFPIIAFVAYKYYRSKNISRITFDYPEALKPTDDDLIYVTTVNSAKNAKRIFHYSDKDEAYEPLRSKGTNIFV